ncbi:MAG TPA: glycosyltransferase [Candidatus Acidoferrales bacterium]|nr:glycosyltransferase [Candidatus Acidoferrales bacterium]
MIKVSVIIPTFNRGYILAEAIQSVLHQTYLHFELIIIDDGSTDGTAAVVAGFEDARIRFVQHPKNAGVSAAQNTGIAHARGTLIAFFASDDLWKPEKLQLQVRFMDEHPEVGGVFSDLEWISGTRHVQSMLSGYPAFCQLLQRSRSGDEMIFPQHELYLCLLEEMPVKLQATILRRDRVQKAGPFQESWQSGEDWEFLLRFTRTNALGYVDRALTVQRTMPDSMLGRHKREDAQSLLERFILEKVQVQDDSKALAAIRRGIANHARELGSCCLDDGERRRAFGAYWRGFAHSNDPKLLTLCAGAVLPRRARQLAKRLRKGHTS